ncbi:hypothetical protein VBZ67_03045 [Campylobacter concisus]
MSKAKVSVNLEDIIASEDFDSFKAAVLASKKAFLQASFKNEELNFIANMTNAYGKKIPFKIKAKFIDADEQKVIYSFTDLSDMLKLQRDLKNKAKRARRCFGRVRQVSLLGIKKRHA